MTFARDVARFAKKANADVDTVIRAGILEMSGQIIKSTPVDTGRAKGNWIPTLSVPYGAIVDTLDDTPKGKASAGIMAAITAVSSGAPGRVYYLTNNLPYIRGLEYGASQQAPAGMVRKTVQAYKKTIAKIARNTK